jgi:glycolate oxidase FAD binding subunit
MSRIQPATPRELAQVLRDAAGTNSTVVLGGSPAESVTVSTASLDKVLQYEPRDLTLSVEAGIPYSRVRSLLADRGQMLPLDPPWDDQATIGGVIATNRCGSRRRLYGTARDLVIGMTYATLEGNLVNSGGMVVKNVAGLDTQKLMIGSFGTLAAVASVNFKLSPLPLGSRTFILRFDNAAECVAARDKVLQSVLQPVALDVLSPGAADFDSWTLLVRAHGSDRVLARYAAELPAAESVDNAREIALWSTIDNFLRDHDTVARVSHPMPALLDVSNLPHSAILARAGSGVSLIAHRTEESLTACMRQSSAKGWRAVVEKSSLSIPLEVQWPDPGDDFETMRSIKTLFDPKGILNPGRLYGRI